MQKIILLTMLIGALCASTPVTDAATMDASVTDAEALEASAPQTAEEILQRIDANRLADGKIVVMSMTIYGRRGDRTIRAKAWQRNTDDSFTEYLAPAREKGVKMLKLGDQLWTYSPDTDRTILISGHLLRQSVMGSDMSYEDMLEDPSLQKTYTARITGEETLRGRPVWVLELTARQDDLAYARRKIRVDRERYIGLQEELYAKSGTLLKQIEVTDVMQVDGRWLAKEMLYKDVLKDGNGTKMVVESLEFNNEIADSIFSRAALRK